MMPDITLSPLVSNRRNDIVGALVERAAPLIGLSLDYNPTLSLLWVTIHPERFCIRRDFLGSVRRLLRTIRNEFTASRPSPDQPIKYIAYRTKTPDVFLYGADFEVFLESIRSGDDRPLLEYATNCMEFCYENHMMVGGTIPTIAVVSGAVYGGGFEAVASCSVVIADPTTDFQLPEIRFSSFPGLAYSIVGRKAPMAALHELVMSGGSWNAHQAQGYCVVDRVADGDLIAATERYVASVVDKHAAHCCALRAMNAVRRIERRELQEIIEEFVRCTMEIPKKSTKFVSKLIEAQSISEASRQRCLAY